MFLVVTLRKKNSLQPLPCLDCIVGRLTGIFGPLQDGRDLVALLGLADAVTSRRADADGVQVGFHSAQERRGRGRAVCNLEVHAVGLHVHTGLKSNIRQEKTY